MADKTLGQVAYEAWWKALGPEPVAGWHGLTVRQRAAWEAAATAAVEAGHG